jgi:hypothetical protein
MYTSIDGVGEGYKLEHRVLFGDLPLQYKAFWFVVSTFYQIFSDMNLGRSDVCAFLTYLRPFQPHLITVTSLTAPLRFSKWSNTNSGHHSCL